MNVTWRNEKTDKDKAQRVAKSYCFSRCLPRGMPHWNGAGYCAEKTAAAAESCSEILAVGTG
jgi:hypothetical protein